MRFLFFKEIFRFNRRHLRPISLPHSFDKKCSPDIEFLPKVVFKNLSSLLLVSFWLCIINIFKLLDFLFKFEFTERQFLDKLACACKWLYMLAWNFHFYHVNQLICESTADV
jgi:hypothetical protein